MSLKYFFKIVIFKNIFHVEFVLTYLNGDNYKLKLERKTDVNKRSCLYRQLRCITNMLL